MKLNSVKYSTKDTRVLREMYIFVLRLGGIPVGVIVPEVRPVEKIVPPDPADPSSETKV